MGQIGYVFNLIFTFPIFNALTLLYHLFGDFGLSIVVLTLVIKLVLFPLTVQQLKSMKANQALQPKMQEINKKHANDQQAKALAMQALYKEYGVNPLAGCLPLLIQLPVLYGLYFALNTVLRNASHSLALVNAPLYAFVARYQQFPDISFKWFSWLQFLNPILHVNWSWAFSLGSPDPTHILPVIAGLATFVQLRMSQPKTAPAPANGKAGPPDPSQQMMKTMQYIMPFFTFFLGLTFPAGLALYWTVSALFQATQQYFVTGWGSLLVTPKSNVALAGNVSTSALSSSNGTAKRSTPRNGLAVVKSSMNGNGKQDSDTAVETEEAVDTVVDSDDDATENVRTSTSPRPSGNGPSQYTRRQRGGSASARRRSSAQRARR